MIDENGCVGEWEWNVDINPDLCIISRPLPKDQQQFYNVATSASITGFVRAFMWRAMCQCSGVLYCDTDSIAALDVSSLDYGDELGQWDLEGRFDYGAIGGRKLYAFHYQDQPQRFDWSDKSTHKHWKMASKGVKLTPEQMIRVAKGSTVLSRS